VLDLLNRPNLKVKWQEKRRRLLAEKIDVTDWMVRFVKELVVKNGDLSKVQI
jgi:hypothetical protein